MGWKAMVIMVCRAGGFSHVVASVWLRLHRGLSLTSDRFTVQQGLGVINMTKMATVPALLGLFAYLKQNPTPQLEAEVDPRET